MLYIENDGEKVSFDNRRGEYLCSEPRHVGIFVTLPPSIVNFPIVVQIPRPLLRSLFTFPVSLLFLSFPVRLSVSFSALPFPPVPVPVSLDGA